MTTLPHWELTQVYPDLESKEFTSAFGSIQDQIMVVRPCPLTKMTFDSLNKGMQVVMRGKRVESS